MNVLEARAAIEAILAAIDDADLPEFDKAELQDDGKVCVWWGDHGRILGSATTNGKRNPIQYRKGGSWAAIEGEMAYRADKRFLENGDSAVGIRLGRKVA